MGKRAEFHPAWLVSLMNQWATRQVPGHRLGYSSGSHWMRGLKSSPSSSIDPTGYAARDFSDLEAALQDLMENGTNLWASMMMYYKPWVVQAFIGEGYPFATSTYYDRLHKAHGEVARFMDQIKAQRARDLEKLGLDA